MKKKVDTRKDLHLTNLDARTQSANQQASSSVVSDLFKRIEVKRKYAL